jgi:hypothetical protein
MDGTDYRRSIGASPRRPRKFVCFLGIVSQEVLNWTGYFLHLAGNIKQIHLVVSISYFVRNAACPRFDLVEVEFLFIIPRLADVNVFVWRKSPRAALIKSSNKHNVAAVNDICNRMVAILACLHHLVFVKVFFVSMNCLLWSVVPTGINPLLARTILPCAEYLSNNRLC